MSDSFEPPDYTRLLIALARDYDVSGEVAQNGPLRQRRRLVRLWTLELCFCRSPVALPAHITPNYPEDPLLRSGGAGSRASNRGDAGQRGPFPKARLFIFHPAADGRRSGSLVGLLAHLHPLQTNLNTTFEPSAGITPSPRALFRQAQAKIRTSPGQQCHRGDAAQHRPLPQAGLFILPPAAAGRRGGNLLAHLHLFKLI